jgi:hypothetical protein
VAPCPYPTPWAGGRGAGVQTSQGAPTKFLLFEKVRVGLLPFFERTPAFWCWSIQYWSSVPCCGMNCPLTAERPVQ